MKGRIELGGRLNVLNCHHLHGIKSRPMPNLTFDGR